MWWNILVTLIILANVVTSQRDCSKNGYDRCIRIADPLVKEAHLVFPDNLNDIDLVCNTWNMFVDCLKTYTDNCFSDQQRKQFNRAVESPIESVHQMCMQPNYQKEYLQYAPCIKNTVISKIHCGPHYNLLVDQVEQGNVISKSILCCSHDRFKQCVLRETRRLCDRGISEGPASKFASQVIDKALRFLQDQCINYIPNSGDCSSTQDSYLDRSYPSSVISTASSEVYPWSTIQHEAKEVAPSRVSKVSTSSTWLASSGSTNPDSGNSAGPGAILPTQNLGTRTRPASYGRSQSWSSEPSSSSTVPTNTLPMHSSSTQNTYRESNAGFRDKFGSPDSWDVQPGYNNRLDGKSVSASPPYRPTDHTTTSNSPYSPLWNPSGYTTEETWYPAAGNQLTNEVDEPNQLGLKKPKNIGCTLKIVDRWVMILLIGVVILRLSVV